MTPKQTRVYWAAWGAVRKADPTADRYELHARAGVPKSSKAFNTTTDFDAILEVFQSISQPSNLNAQLRQARQHQARITHARYHHEALLRALGIEHAEAYLQKILHQRFKVKFITDLGTAPTYGRDQQRGPSQLSQYVYTVSRAIDRLRQKKHWTQHDLYTRAALDCPCLACSQSRARQQATAPEPEPAMAEAPAPNQPF